MMSYSSNLEIFRYLSFRKRKALAQKAPQLRNLHKTIPLRLSSLSIFETDTHFNIIIDTYSTWIFEKSGKTIIHHRKYALDPPNCTWPTKFVDVSKNEMALRFFEHYFNRDGTKVKRLTLKGYPKIPESLPRITKMEKLAIYSDGKIEDWIHFVPRGISDLKLYGNQIFELLAMEEITANLKTISTNGFIDYRKLAFEKLKNVEKITFTLAAGNYNLHRELDKELTILAHPSRKIGQIIEYNVCDMFNTKLYPNLRQMRMGIRCRMDEKNGRTALFIPMDNTKELHVYVVPQNPNLVDKPWILRIEVIPITELDVEGYTM